MEATKADTILPQLDEPRELINDRRQNLVIQVHWLKMTNEIMMTLIDLDTLESNAFMVPNDKVMDAYNHPFIYAGAKS